ncbi:MAG: aspartyl protease family protein [Planctomycetes bacterium]|nr:aspartyl protease family protein [Planctomycetota bacterium]
MKDESASTQQALGANAAPPQAAPPWWVVLGVTFLFGVMVGGVAVYSFFPRVKSAPVETEPAPRSATPPASEETAPEVAAEPVLLPALEEREDLTAAAPVEPIAAEEEVEPLDSSPLGLRRAFGAAVLSLTAFDEEGDSRPPVPAVLLGPSTLLAPYSAVEGAAHARVRGSDRGTTDVEGVLAHAPQYDLVLLALAADLPEPHLRLSPEVIGSTVDAVLIGAVADPAWQETAVRLSPGSVDPWSGGPRLTLERAAGFAGAALDAQGMVVALAPDGTRSALAVHPAAPWIASALSAVPLEAFSRTAGPGSPPSRLARARKLLQQRRYEEAARLLLVVTAEEPRLIPEARPDLHRAAEEAARQSITAGNGFAAVALLTETLVRLPDDADLWALRGRGHGVSGDIRLAIESFLRAGEIDPGQAENWRGEARGLLLEEANRLHAQGYTAAALSLLLEERGSFPGDGRLRVTAGRLLLQSRRFAEAAQVFSEAAAMDATVAGEAREEAARARDLAGGPGAIIIDFAPGSAQVVVAAVIDGRASAELLISPGDELSVIPPAVAQAAGYALAAAPRVRFFADPGAAEVPSVQLRTVTVAGVPCDRVQAVVVDGYAAPAAQGVLGASFLSRFRLVEDRSLGRLVLHPR